MFGALYSIFYYKNMPNYFKCSVASITNHTGLSVERQRKAIKVLVEKGLICYDLVQQDKCHRERLFYFTFELDKFELLRDRPYIEQMESFDEGFYPEPED